MASILRLKDKYGNIIEVPAIKGDKGDNGKDAVIDQSYNPESENAQSGKAVAEALAKIPSGGGDSAIKDGQLVLDGGLEIRTTNNYEEGNPPTTNYIKISENIDALDLLTIKGWNTEAIFSQACIILNTDQSNVIVDTDTGVNIGAASEVNVSGGAGVNIVTPGNVNLTGADVQVSRDAKELTPSSVITKDDLDKALANVGGDQDSDTKANIEFAPIYIGENVNVWDWRSEDGIYTLEDMDSPDDVGEDVVSHTLVFDNANIAFAVNATPTDFAKFGFVVGKDYKLAYTDVVNGKVERVIDLKDKVNITDFETALANKLTKPTPAADGSMVIPNVKGDGTEGSMKVRYYPDKYCVPAYSYDGNIKVNTPIVDLDAANKKYVDDKVGKGFELLCDTTTTEDVASVKWTTTDSGEPIGNYKDFFIYFLGKFTASVNNEVMMCSGNGGGQYFMYRTNYAKSADIRSFWLLIETIITTDKIDSQSLFAGDGLFIRKSTYPQNFLSNADNEGNLATQGTAGNNQAVMSDITIRNLAELPLTELHLGTNTVATSVFASGSRFLLFGRK